MEEAEALCDELLIIDHGIGIAAGTLDELREMMGERDLLRLNGEFDPAAAGQAIVAMPGVEVLQAEPTVLQLAMEGASQRLPEVFAALGAIGATVSETRFSRPSLESLFIKLTGRELRG